MLKWMVTSGRGRDDVEDEVSLAEAGQREDEEDIYIISRSHTGHETYSSGYSSGDQNNSLSRAKIQRSASARYSDCCSLNPRCSH